jgi:hypothetical protein
MTIVFGEVLPAGRRFKVSISKVQNPLVASTGPIAASVGSYISLYTLPINSNRVVEKSPVNNPLPQLSLSTVQNVLSVDLLLLASSSAGTSTSAAT